VVAQLVALHGGRAWVEAAPGTGARFVVFVPPDSEGYSLRDMEAGKDEGKVGTVESLRERLLSKPMTVAGGAPGGTP